MNARRDEISLQRAIEADPLASMSADRTAIADLAFGSFSRSTLDANSLGRHLALLSTDSLELDLSDPAQRQFGDYELLEMIGEGGMGVVYRARQHSLDRDVAVKLLAAGPWASNEFIERFRREAQNAARMQHPNIVAIYEVGNAEELHFFSMRLIRGGSLSGLLKRDGKLAPARAAQLLRTVAEAVDYAHRLGVLHLDLKPANVLLDDNGAPHVADFGLARRFEQDVTADNNEVSGTPSYMAPEQATAGAQKITPATDIWGLGAILYELVTGQPPFLADSPHATLALVVNGERAPPRQLTPDLPRDLAAIIDKCMAYAISARYATGRALADDLGRFLENRPVQARPLNVAQRTWRWARRQPYIAALGVLFSVSMLAGIIGVSAQWRRAEFNATRAAASANEAQATAMVSSERLWASRRDAAIRQQLDGKGFEALPALIANVEEQEKAGRPDAGSSVERREIGMILSQGVTLIDRMIVPDAPPLAAELSPDGNIFALGLGDLTVRWYDTQTMSEIGRVDLGLQPTSSGEEIAPKLLRFIDNKHLLVTLDWPDYLASPSGHDMFLIDLEHARVLTPPEQFSDFTDASFSSDGRYALLFNRSKQMQAWHVDPWQPLSAKTAVPSGADCWWVARDGKFAAYTANAPSQHAMFYDLRDMSKARHDVSTPGSGVTAWAEDDSGANFAIGDESGNVYLYDPRSATVRHLPTPAGLEVTWLAFGEEGAWLAAVRRDGSIFAFEVASGRPLNSGQMHEDFDVREVTISKRDRLLVASGNGETSLWRFPESGSQGQEAHRLISRPTASARAGTHAVGSALLHRMLLTANRDGEIRLWRIPQPSNLPMKQSTANSSMADTLYFDGEHLVDVDYAQLRVVSMRDGSSMPWLRLPNPVGYAELLDHGATLLATSGATLHVFDAATMQPRFPAIELPATPQGLAADAKGDFAVLAFGHNGTAGFEEQLLSFDIRHGRRLGDARVSGPLRQLQVSDDARRLVAVGPPQGATQVFDPHNMQRVGAYAHNPARPVLRAGFLPDAEQLWLLTVNDDGLDVMDADLQRWSPASNRMLEQRHIAEVVPVGVFAATGKPLLATTDHDLLDPGTANTASSMRLHGEVSAVLTASHDRRLIAHALGNEVRLYEADTLASIGPPLQASGHTINMVQRIAFSDDDRFLLAQTANGQVVWPVAVDARPLAQIRADMELLSVESGSAHVLQMSGAVQRKQLRDRDPGDRSIDAQRPPQNVARWLDDLPIMARAPQLSPLLLDLTDNYSIAPGRLRTINSTIIPNARHFPLGLTRIDGVDYDIRGLIELRTTAHGGVANPSAANPLAAPLSRITGIRVPALPIAALNVLMYASLDVPVVDERSYCSIRLHYRDGSSAVLPLRIQRELAGGSDRDQVVPLAWSQSDHLRLIGIMKQMLVGNPRLLNPHPEKIITTLDLETGSETWNEPLFYAITAEPVIPSGNSPSTGTEHTTRDEKVSRQ